MYSNSHFHWQMISKSSNVKPPMDLTILLKRSNVNTFDVRVTHTQKKKISDESQFMVTIDALNELHNFLGFRSEQLFQSKW